MEFGAIQRTHTTSTVVYTYDGGFFLPPTPPTRVITVDFTDQIAGREMSMRRSSCTTTVPLMPSPVLSRVPTLGDNYTYRVFQLLA